MPRCSVCEVRLPLEPEQDCDGEMENCRRVCGRLHMEDVKDGLTFCTSCFIWLIGAYNDILAGRPFDPQAVRYLRLMVLDQTPLLSKRVRDATTGAAKRARASVA